MPQVNNEPPSDAEASEDQKLFRIAQEDSAILRRKQSVLSRIVHLLLSPRYIFTLPLWSKHMTIDEVRQTEATFLEKPKLEWYVPRWLNTIACFYFLNWLLKKLHDHVRKLGLDANDGKHAAYVIREIWIRTFGGNNDFFQCFAELRPREFEDFLSRDTSYFMSRNGNIISNEMHEVLYFVLLLTPRGNKLMRYLYVWLGNLLSEKIKDKDSEKFNPILKFLIGDPGHRLSQIRNVRRDSLWRIEKYADNMLHFALDSGSHEAATLWNEVLCRVRELKGFRPSPAMRGKLAGLVQGLAEQINSASKQTYVIYKEQEQAASQTSQHTSRTTGKKCDAAGQSTTKTTVIGRFTFETTQTHYILTTMFKNKKKTYKFRSSSNAGRYARQLLMNYKTGTDQTIVSDQTWKGAFQKRRGDATKFKDDQIFMLPRWDGEKGHFLHNQMSGRWRLWTDEEMLMSRSERMKKFIADHPNGLPR